MRITTAILLACLVPSVANALSFEMTFGGGIHKRSNDELIKGPTQKTSQAIVTFTEGVFLGLAEWKTTIAPLQAVSELNAGIVGEPSAEISAGIESKPTTSIVVSTPKTIRVNVQHLVERKFGAEKAASAKVLPGTGITNCCDTHNDRQTLINDYTTLPAGEYTFSHEASSGLTRTHSIQVKTASVNSIVKITELQAGDADTDFDFDQEDLVQLLATGKYLKRIPALWIEGDFNFDGLFNQLDIIEMASADAYLQGPYAALNFGGNSGDEQTSMFYDAGTGELSIDSPASKDLTSINITSAGSKFIGNKPAVLDGAFDNFAADNIFKATFGGSFGDISFGNVLPAGLSFTDVAADVTVIGSLAGGGDLGTVDLIWIPEPSSLALLLMACLLITPRRR